MKFRSLLFSVLLFHLVSTGQRISYSVPENEDARTVDFEIIGKVGANILVFKSLRSSKYISIYDNEMALKDKVELDFMPDKTLNAEFIVYPDHAYMFYQFQKRNILHCMAVKIDGNGKKIGDPVELDTTQISIFADNKIYNMVNSEDKQRIMIFKIQKKYDKFNFTTVLFNSQLQLQHRSRMQIPYDERKDVFTDFYLDNEGTFVGAKSIKEGNRELISKLFLLTKSPFSNQFSEKEFPLNKSFLDEVMLKVDNVNGRFILNSFYYNQKRGNIDGLYTAIWDKTSGKLMANYMTEFSDTMKREAKTDGALRFAYNDYFIRNIVLKKDGGFILSAEDFSRQSRSSQWNRMDYLSRYPYISSYDYYTSLRSPYSYYTPRNVNSVNRYYYNNIVVMSVDKDGKLAWSNVIRKEQFDDGDDNFLSYHVMNAGGELHFLFNELERRTQLISDQSIAPDGRITRNPTLKSLDKGYQFMPRFARQVSAKQVIVPCIYRNYICFAKIDY